MRLRQSRLPDRVFTVALLRRALFLWVGIKAFFVAAAGNESSARTAFLTVLLVGFLGLLDSRRRNEHIFWANLGVAPWMLAALSSIPAMAGELVVAWIGNI